MVARIFSISGLDGPMPDFSSLSPHQKSIPVQISNRCGSGPLNLPMESTGLKMGE